MECKNCSGNHFKKTKTGNYKCSYCGTLYFSERRSEVEGPVTGKFRYLLLYSMFALITVVSVAVLYNLPKERDVQEKTSVKKRDLNRDESGSGKELLYHNKTGLPSPSARIVSINSMPDSIGNIYFLVIVENTGKVSIRKPMVLVRLYSPDGQKIDTGRGYGFKDILNPGEKTPVYILIRDYPKFRSYKTEFKPELPYFPPGDGIVKKKFKAKISDVVLKKASYGNSHNVMGRIKNISGKSVTYAKVGAVLMNSKGKPIGYGTAYTAEKVLKPGDSDRFKIYITTVKGVPEKYKLYYDAMEK